MDFGLKYKKYAQTLIFSLLSFPLFCEPLQADIQALERAIEKQDLIQAELLLKALQPKAHPHLISEASIRLAHQEWQIGAHDRASELLDEYWPLIEKSPLASFGWTLRAQLASLNNEDLAYYYFQKAEQLQAIQNWPSEDSTTYALLCDKIKTTFDNKLASVDRLIDCQLDEEAMRTLTLLIDSLMNHQIPGYSLDDHEGISLLRNLLLKKAQLALNQDQPQTVLDTFEKWPILKNFSDERDPKKALNQQLQLQFLESKGLWLLGRTDEAFKSLENCFELGKTPNADPFQLFKIYLFYSQALQQDLRNEQALESLQKAKSILSHCRYNEQQEGLYQWTSQYTRLMNEMGKLHQALEELKNCLSLAIEPTTRSQLIYLQADLLTQLQEYDQALDCYLNLITLPTQPYQTNKAILFIIDKLQSYQNQPEEALQLTQKIIPILSNSLSFDIDPSSKLHLCQWIIEHGFCNRDLLKKALTSWLESIQHEHLRPRALYLLIHLSIESPNYKPYLDEIIHKWPLKNSWSRLSLAFVHYCQNHQNDSWMKLADLSKQPQDQASPQILYWAVDKSLESSDIHALTWAEEQLTSLSELEKSQLSWQLLTAHLNLKQKHAQIHLKSIQELRRIGLCNGPLGLKAVRILSDHLAQQNQLESAHQLLQDWSTQHPFPDDLSNKCLLHDAELLCRYQSPKAKGVIKSILEKITDFEQKPWLQLQLFSHKDYEELTQEAIENLHQIILNYKEHPASLHAYFLLACSQKSQLSTSQQLHKWEDIEKKANFLSKLGIRISPETESLVIQSNLNKVMCLEKMGMYEQASSALNSLLTKNAGRIAVSNSAQNLEFQICYELGRLHLIRKQDDLAIDQFRKLIHAPYTTLWQSYAQIELAHLAFSKNKFAEALHLLQEISLVDDRVSRKRLLLSAQIWMHLQDKRKANACLAQLIAQPEPSDEQINALWLIYQWSLEVDPPCSLRALKKLSTHMNHPLGKKAYELIQTNSSTKKEDL
jgi:tetratricopeptide (TPR) repeat protein